MSLFTFNEDCKTFNEFGDFGAMKKLLKILAQKKTVQ